MSVVMAGVSVTINRSNAVISAQNGRQVANRLVVEGMEKIQQMPGSAVAGQIASVQDAGAVLVNGLSFTRTYTVSKCWQPAAGGACSAVQTANSVSLVQATVAVSWRDRLCASAQCTVSANTLLSDVADEPMFNSDATTAYPAVPPLKVETPSCTIFFFFTMSGCTKGLNMQIDASGGTGQYTYGYKTVGLFSILAPALNPVTGSLALNIFAIFMLIPSWVTVSATDKITGKKVSSRSFVWFPLLF